MTTTSNMGLSQPLPGSSGPEWANELNANATLIDEHDHSSGKGVAITPSGININTDLTTNEHKVIDVKSVKFVSQAASLVDTNALDVYIKNGDLFYANGLTDVQITNGGSVAGANGTITGLASPASSSFAGQQFSFFYDAGTYADLRARDVILSTNGGGGFTIKVTHTATSSYVMSLPPAPPSTNSQMMTMATSGQVSANTSPTLGNTSSVFTWQGTTNSTAVGNGALVVAGGVSVGQTLRVGNGSRIANGLSITNGGLGIDAGGATIVGVTAITGNTTITGSLTQASGGFTTTGSVVSSSTVTCTGVTSDNWRIQQRFILTNLDAFGALIYVHGLISRILSVTAFFEASSGVWHCVSADLGSGGLNGLYFSATEIRTFGGNPIYAFKTVRLLITHGD